MKKLPMLALVLAACGGPPSGSTRSCTITVSGALNGTYDCRPAITVWSPTIGEGHFAFAVPGVDDSRPEIDAAIGWSGEPKPMHYLSSAADAQSSITVTVGQDTWYVTAEFGKAKGGSYDFNVARILSSGEYYNGKAYTMTGTLDATMDASLTNKTAGPLTLHVSF